MSDNEMNADVIKTRAIDYVASGAKAIVGTVGGAVVPFAGSFLAEIVGFVIPNQRMDRLADFTAKLEDRVKNIEKGKITSQFNDEEFTDLVEEALHQAARSTTEDRRRYLASLVANSISSDAIEHAESKHLIRLLGELNDVEVLWLRFFHAPTIGGDKEFRELHKEIFASRQAYIGCSSEELDDHALQKSYKEHLVQLGLVTRHISKDREGNPEFDKFSGDFKVSYYEVSPLGRLLLRTIGLIETKT
jgi:hypothetical protein